jgi:hypothetical protein
MIVCPIKCKSILGVKWISSVASGAKGGGILFDQIKKLRFSVFIRKLSRNEANLAVTKQQFLSQLDIKSIIQFTSLGIITNTARRSRKLSPSSSVPSYSPKVSLRICFCHKCLETNFNALPGRFITSALPKYLHHFDQE